LYFKLVKFVVVYPHPPELDSGGILYHYAKYYDTGL